MNSLLFKSILISFALIVCSLFSFAQVENISFKHLTIEDGLSQNAVFALLQDSRGFMWFGTKDGLNKYNGYSFTEFTHNPYDSSTISSNFIKLIFEDSRGYLWIVTLNGELNLMNSTTENFIRIPYNDKDPSGLSSKDIHSIAEDKNGNIWIGTFGGGLNKIDADNILNNNFTFTHFKFDSASENSLRDNNILSLLVDEEGILWIGTSTGLEKLINEPKNIFKHYNIDIKNNSSLENISSKRIKSILSDDNQTLWLGSTSGITEFNKSTAEYTHYPNKYAKVKYGWGEVLDILRDDADNLWVATAGGLMLFNLHSKKYSYFYSDPQNKNSISHTGITKLLKDKSGNIWIGTNGYGINIYYPEANRFKSFPYKKFAGKFNANLSIRSLFEDADGNIWFSEEVLHKWNRKTNSLISYKNEKNWNALGSTGAWSIIQDSENNLWFATYRGLYKLNPETNKSIHLKFNKDDANGLPEEVVNSVFEDADGTIWAVTQDYLCRLVNEEESKFINYRFYNSRTAYSVISSSVYQDKDKNIWFTSDYALVKFNISDEKFTFYTNNPSVTKSINNNSVRSICPDPVEPDKILWIGTAGGGLNRFNIADESFTHYTEADGLPNNVVYGILPDDEGNLWMSTNRGISKFNIAAFQFTNYNVYDGLQSNEFNSGAYYKSKSGELFFGGIDGFNFFLPENVAAKNSVPTVVFTDFKIFNKSVSVKDKNSILKKIISETEAIKLSHNHNVISFEFASLDYYAPSKNKFAYKLKGFSEEWIQLGTKREVSFTNLDPGEYVLKVKGTNSDGIWNENGASIKLIITPPFWQTWWAYSIYGLILISFLYFIRRYELNRMKLKNQLKVEKIESKTLRKIDQMKSQFFTNISHEFRTPLTLILGQIDSLQSLITNSKNREKLQVAHKNAQRVLRLINQLLDLAKLESGKTELNAQPQNIVTFLKSLFYSFESLAEKRNIKLSFKSVQQNIIVNIEPEKVEKVFYNLLSNAFKFTPDRGKISITVLLSNHSQNIKNSPKKINDENINYKFAQIKIKDSGEGIPPDELEFVFNRFYRGESPQTSHYEGTGIGLALAKELIELHNGSIYAESTPGNGAEFIISLPLSTEKKFDTMESLPDETPKFLVSGIFNSNVHNVPADEFSKPIIVQRENASTEEEINKQIVLVAEDNKDVRNYICEQLEDDYFIIRAVNGREAMTKAQEVVPDLIVTDVMMPAMDGFALCKEIRNNEKTSHIPIIMLTAKATLDDKLQGLQTGVDAYLTKPFSAKELKIRVENLIRQREKLRKRFTGKTIIKPSDVTAASIEQKFLGKIFNAVELNIKNENFSVEDLAEEACMSVSQLNRKLKALIDQPAGQLIRSMRLNRAADLLRQNAGSVAEICYTVGFADQSYFTRSFKKQFGITPLEFKKQKTA